jgi:pimeloyl-ACP methyl ester carboxylesterase
MIARSIALSVSLLLCVSISARSQTGRVKVDGAELYYEAEGTGAPVILIHGWSLNLRMWDRQVPDLRRHYRVIRYDRRGFGKSTGDEDFSKDVADLGALIDSLHLDKVHLVANSQAGPVALEYAIQHPDKVRTLTLHGSIAPSGFPLTWSGSDSPPFQEWLKIPKEQRLDAFRRSWKSHPLMAIPAGMNRERIRRDELIDAYRGYRLLNPQPPAPSSFNSMDELRQLKTPTLVIIGADEIPFLQIVARSLAYYLPNAQLVVVPGGGHMINLVQPTRYNAVLRKFFGSK